MPKSLWLALILILGINLLFSLTSAKEVFEVSKRIVEQIDTGDPVIIEIRAGQYSRALADEVKSQLLKKGADLREAQTDYYSPASDSLDEATYIPAKALAQLGIKKARLILVEMELDWKTVEKRGFLSYSSTRIPLYHFYVKQISLPSGQLLQLESFSREADTSTKNQNISKGITWFEPMLITTALASIIYLLWTTQ